MEELYFSLSTRKNALGGGTYEWEWAVKNVGSVRRAGTTSCLLLSVPHSSSADTPV